MSRLNTHSKDFLLVPISVPSVSYGGSSKYSALASVYIPVEMLVFYFSVILEFVVLFIMSLLLSASRNILLSELLYWIPTLQNP